MHTFLRSAPALLLLIAMPACLSADKKIVNPADTQGIYVDVRPSSPGSYDLGTGGRSHDDPGGGVNPSQDPGLPPVGRDSYTPPVGTDNGSPPPSDPGGAGTDPGPPPSDPGGSPVDPGGSPSDPGSPADPGGEPGCAPFTVRSFEVAGGLAYARFNQKITVQAQIDGAPQTTTVTVEPQSMAAFFSDLGGGTAELQLTQVDETFRTTPVTFKLSVAANGCSVEREASVKVLGNLWVTEIGADVVQCFRSDGSFIMQAVSSTYLRDPYSLYELGPDRILVGNHSLKQSLIEVFDRRGVRQYGFEHEEENGTTIFSIYGADTIMKHPTNGEIWVGGPRGYLVVYSDDGTFQRKLHLGYSYDNLEPNSLVSLADGTTVLVPETTLDWYLFLLDPEGEVIGRFGNNSAELEIEVKVGAVANDSHLIFTGKSPGGDGYVTLLRNTGQMVKRSERTEDVIPRWGVMAFGDGFLVITDRSATNDNKLAYYDSELNLVTESFTGEKLGQYRGMMILGGN
jgi:hypothetical protein